MKAEKYLVFNVEKNLFGLPYSEVLEVGTIENRARIPLAPNIMPEVFNNHGMIIPLLDLPLLLGFPDADRSNFLLIRGEEYNVSLATGPVVGIEESNEILRGEVPEYVKRIIKIFDRRVYIIDTEKVFNRIKKEFKEE